MVTNNFKLFSQAEFIVNFSGTPIPKVSWFKDGFEIFSSRRTRIITENGKSILLIHQAALSDEGEIKCTATNRAGYASTQANLILEGQYQFISIKKRKKKKKIQSQISSCIKI